MPDWFLEIRPAKRIPALRDTEVGKEGVAGTIPDSSSVFDYLEDELDGKDFLVGDRFSIVDITVACCLMQMTIVIGNPDAARWPSLVAHYERTLARETFQPTLASPKKLVPQPFDI